MKFEYQTVDISKLQGLKKGERLQRQGWQSTIIGINKLQFYRPQKVSVKKKK